MIDSDGQLSGPALNLASGHAFWRVGRRDGSSRGIVRKTLWMFACPTPADSSFTLKLVPFTRLPCPVVEAVSFGANGSAEQPVSWKGADTGATAPSEPNRVPPTDSGSQFVPLNWKFG